MQINYEKTYYKTFLYFILMNTQDLNSRQRREGMAKLAEILLAELISFNRFSLTDANTSFPYEILEKKLNGSPLRAFFIKTLYEYAVEEAKLEGKLNEEQRKFFTRQLPFILECIICIQYYHNQILDRKGNVNTPEAINFNLIDGNQFERQLNIYIRKKTLIFEVEHIQAIEQQIEEIFQLVDVGQEIEKKHLTCRGWESNEVGHRYHKALEKHIGSGYIEFLMATAKAFDIFPKEKEAFLELYFSKIYLINAVLYRNAARLISTILGLNQELSDKLETIATLFALMHQIVNDNGDFVPPHKKENTVEKTIWDAFSDLKNENITLPMQLNLLLYRNEKKNIRSRIIHFYRSRSRRLTLCKAQDIFKEMTNSKAIYISMSIAKQMKELAMEILAWDEPGGRNTPALQLLRDMFKVADNNKYYRHYYKERLAYRRYKRWKKEHSIEHKLKAIRNEFYTVIHSEREASDAEQLEPSQSKISTPGPG